MKKLFLLSVFSILTLSSFTTFNNLNIEDNTELQRWNYSCNDGTGHTGSFLMPVGSTQAQALSVAGTICRQRREV